MGFMIAGLTLVMSGPGYDPAVAGPDRAEMQCRNQARLALLPPDLYPRLVEAAAPMTACAPEDQEFHHRFGIDLFLAALQAMALRPAGEAVLRPGGLTGPPRPAAGHAVPACRRRASTPPRRLRPPLLPRPLGSEGRHRGLQPPP